MMKTLGTVILICLFAGCTKPTGFDRGALRSQLSLGGATVTDEDIAGALANKPQLRFPAKIAVYFAHPAQEYYWRGWGMDWDEDDKGQLLSLKERLQTAGIASDMFLVSDMVVLGSGDEDLTLKDIRLGAARYHADAVLIIRGIADIDRYSNLLSIAYLTIVGFWVAPGSHCDAMFMADATLLDVRNEYLYLTAQSEATAGVVQPTALLKESVPIQRAKTEALKQLVQELEKRFQNLKGGY